MWGLVPHPSDELIHWSRRRKDHPDFNREIAELRAAWDLIHADPKIAAAHEVLTRWVIELEGSKQGELNAGADL